MLHSIFESENIFGALYMNFCLDILTHLVLFNIFGESSLQRDQKSAVVLLVFVEVVEKLVDLSFFGSIFVS